MLQAICQGTFKFLGKVRKSGDVITAEELGQTTLQNRDALRDQKLIILVDENGDSVSGRDTAANERGGVTLATLAREVAALSAKVDLLLGKTAPEAPTKGRGGKRKKGRA